MVVARFKYGMNDRRVAISVRLLGNRCIDRQRWKNRKIPVLQIVFVFLFRSGYLLSTTSFHIPANSSPHTVSKGSKTVQIHLSQWRRIPINLRAASVKNDFAYPLTRQEMFQKSTILPFFISYSWLFPEKGHAQSAVYDAKNVQNQLNNTRIKPYAPLEALLPAARVKLSIDKAVIVAHQLVVLSKTRKNDDTSILEIQSLITQLSQLLLDSPNYMTNETTIPSSTLSSRAFSGVSQYYQRDYAEQIRSLPPSDIPLALLTQAGEYRQYNLLRDRQRKLEKENAVRAALNAYTSQLRFDPERYIWNATPEERKRFIRQYDSLPDVKAVIVSDLDLRDLIRNQILDAWDDARAEFQYQMDQMLSKEKDRLLPRDYSAFWASWDGDELESLLVRAQKYCSDWFSLIPESDVDEALAVVQMRSKTV